MADTKVYDVLVQHEGDRHYARGDTREALPADVKHLVDAGVLVERTDEPDEGDDADDDSGAPRRRGRPRKG
jgi:hypothetical protein